MTLLKESVRSLHMNLQPVLIGAVLFGTILFGVQLTFEKIALKAAMDGIVEKGNWGHLEVLVERMQSGDEEALGSIMHQLHMMADNGDIAPDVSVLLLQNVLVSILPSVLMLMVVSFMVLLAGSTYYITVATGKESDTLSALKRVPGLLLPIVGVSVWAFLRSFGWVPFIGPLFAVIIGPRLILSSVILVQEGRGVIESVRLSYERTTGYWRAIVINLFVMMLAILLALIVAAIVMAVMSGISPMLGAYFATVMQLLFVAFGTIFLVQLSETVKAQQR